VTRAEGSATELTAFGDELGLDRRPAPTRNRERGNRGDRDDRSAQPDRGRQAGHEGEAGAVAAVARDDRGHDGDAEDELQAAA
jgi:hypothetical protein